MAKHTGNDQIPEKVIYIFPGAGAVGVSMFLITLTSTEHVPAAGVALGVVISPWTVNDLVLAMIGIIAIKCIQKIFHKNLTDLLES